MAKHVKFPDDAFRKEKFTERLRHIFTGRAYRAEDVTAIRTSIHYKNFRSDGPDQKYETAIGFAHRRQDGLFDLHITRNTVVHNPIQGMFSILHHGENEDLGTCCEHEIIARMKEIEKKLYGESELSQAYPNNAPLRYRGALHIDAAAMVFAEPATYYDIETNINRNMINDSVVAVTGRLDPA